MLLNHLSQLIIRTDNAWIDKPFPYSLSLPIQESDDINQPPVLRQDDVTQVNGQLPCPKNKESPLETWHAPWRPHLVSEKAGHQHGLFAKLVMLNFRYLQFV
jgi:hypothetical protein